MDYKSPEIVKASKELLKQLSEADDKRSVLRSPVLNALFDQLKTLPAGKARADFGKEVNALKAELQKKVREASQQTIEVKPIDVTAPFDINVPADQRPALLSAASGSRHPLSRELEKILDIFARMGFTAVESREIDDDYHMFTSLNFPPDHPARADYDTFMTDEGFIAPAHTSTMQNRVLRAGKEAL